MLIPKELVLCVKVACTTCLTFHAKEPWESMTIYKTNSTVEIICGDRVWKLLWRAEPAKELTGLCKGFGHFKGPGHESCTALFLGSPQGPWARACTRNCGLDAFNYHKPQDRWLPSACCCLNCEQRLPLVVVRVAGLSTKIKSWVCCFDGT
jgi:hypothetical protein